MTPEDTKPLSIPEATALRRKAEAQERERITRLREEYEAHAMEMRSRELAARQSTEKPS